MDQNAESLYSCGLSAFIFIQCMRNYSTSRCFMFIIGRQRGEVYEKNKGSVLVLFLKIGAFTFGGGYAMVALLGNGNLWRTSSG